MSSEYEYGDHITLMTLSDLFNIQILIVSSLDDGNTLISPDGSTSFRRDIPVIALGHFHEGGGEHFVTLENNNDIIMNIMNESVCVNTDSVGRRSVRSRWK